MFCVNCQNEYSFHFTIKHIVSYYIDLELILSELVFYATKSTLYHVSLLQYYNYCVPLYLHHYLLYLLLYVFWYLLNIIDCLYFAFAAKFLLVRHVINLTFCSV